MVLKLIKKKEKPKKYSDSEIVVGIQKNDKTFQEYFYNECKKYFDQNYGSVFIMEKSLKDDIFQETYIKLWNDIEDHRIYIGNDGKVWRIDRNGNNNPMTTHLRPFLMDIAKNVYRVWLRKPGEVLMDDLFPVSSGKGEEDGSYFDKVTSTASPWADDDPIITKYSDSFDQGLSDDDQRGTIIEIVQIAIMHLSATCRDILTKIYYEGKTLDEILSSRDENSSKDGLKTSKYKCMKRFEADVINMFEKKHINCPHK